MVDEAWDEFGVAVCECLCGVDGDGGIPRITDDAFLFPSRQNVMK